MHLCILAVRFVVMLPSYVLWQTKKDSNFHIEQHRFSAFAYLFTHMLWDVPWENSIPPSQTFTNTRNVCLCSESNFHMLLTLQWITLSQRSWYFAAILYGLSVMFHHSNENLDINKRMHTLKNIYPHILLKVFRRKWGFTLFS